MIAKIAALPALLIALLALIACAGNEPIADNVPTAPTATSAPIEDQSPTSGDTNLQPTKSPQTPDFPTNQETPKTPPLISAREVTPPTLEAFREELIATRTKTPDPDQSSDEPKYQPDQSLTDEASNGPETPKEEGHIDPLEIRHEAGTRQIFILHYSPYTHKDHDFMGILFPGSFFQAPSQDDLIASDILCWATALEDVGDPLGCARRNTDLPGLGFDITNNRRYGGHLTTTSGTIEGLIKHPFQKRPEVEGTNPFPEGSFQAVLLDALAEALVKESTKLKTKGLESIKEGLSTYGWHSSDDQADEREAVSHWDFVKEGDHTVDVHVYGRIEGVKYIFGFQVEFQRTQTRKPYRNIKEVHLCPPYGKVDECLPGKSPWDFMPKRVHRAYLILPQNKDQYTEEDYHPIPIELDHPWWPDQDRCEVMGYRCK